MAKYSTTLFATAIFDTSGNTTHKLFGAAYGTGTGYEAYRTNMRGAGSLPSEENFLVKKISAFVDNITPVADVDNIWYHSYATLFVRDNQVFQAPLSMLIDMAGYSGEFHEASNTALSLIQRLGNGFTLDMPIEIGNGESFRLDIYQGTALSATLDVVLALSGTLDR